MNNNNFIELKSKAELIIKKEWFECSNFCTGNVGLLFERLLGLNNHNFSIPDYETIEIKTKLDNSGAKISLFNATPDSYLYTIKYLHDTYGYPDRKNPNFKVFNFSFCTKKKVYVNRKTYAKLYVDRKSENIKLHFFNTDDILIDSQISWSFKMLEEKLRIKLQYLFLIYAKTKRSNNKTYCKYLKYSFFRYKGFQCFLDAIESGDVVITFKIGIFKSGKRYGQIHDHGTGFDLNTKNIEKVFSKISINE